MYRGFEVERGNFWQPKLGLKRPHKSCMNATPTVKGVTELQIGQIDICDVRDASRASRQGQIPRYVDGFFCSNCVVVKVARWFKINGKFPFAIGTSWLNRQVVITLPWFILIENTNKNVLSRETIGKKNSPCKMFSHRLLI